MIQQQLQILKDATTVACIGTEYATDSHLLACAQVGAYLGLTKKRLVTGNAKGCDQAYATGVNRFDPTLVNLLLPYKRYQLKAIVPGNHVLYEPLDQWAEIARPFHPIYDKLKPSTQGFLKRNAGIVTNSNVVIAYPMRPKTGGTGHGMRIAKGLGIALIDISLEENMEELMAFITPYFDST